MTPLVPRFPSSLRSWLNRRSPIYFRPRPQEITNYALAALALDLLVTVAAFLLAEAATGARLFDDDISRVEIVLLVVVVWLVMFLVMAVYPAERLHSIIEETFRAAIAAASGFLILVAILTLSATALAQDFLLSFIAFDIFLVVAWRLVVHTLFSVPPFNRAIQRTMVIGVNDHSLSFTDVIAKDPKSQIRICGFLDDCADEQVMGFPVLGGSHDDLQTIIEENGIDSVVIVMPNQPDASFDALLEKLRILPVSLHVIPEYFGLGKYRSSAEAVDHTFTTHIRRVGIGMRQRILKRLFDLIVASIALLLVLPVGVVVAIAIALDSKGSIFFKQLRVGEYQQRFHMYKFRSMVENAEALQNDVNEIDEQGNLIHKRSDDPRVTRVGRIIRKTSLDELPQLFNVLLGDMSLVGPRPEMPWVVSSYQPWQYQRFMVPPGMTGWWQINGRSEEQPMYLGTEQDLYYIEHYSFLLDLKILALTIPVILSGKGSF